MNERQRRAWVIAGIAAFICVLVPPFALPHRFVLAYSGHSFFWSPPGKFHQIHFPLLGLQLLLVGLSAGVAHLVLGSDTWVSRIRQSIRRAMRAGARVSPESLVSNDAFTEKGRDPEVLRGAASAWAARRDAEPYIGEELQSACPSCGQRVVLKGADSTKPLQVTCPSCKQEWRHQPPDS